MHDKQRINTGIVYDDSKKKKHKEADKNKRTDYITDHKTKKQKSSYCIEQLGEQHHTNSISSEQSMKKKEKHREEQNSETKRHYDNTKLTENSNDIALKSNLTKKFDKSFDCFQDVSNSSVETSLHKKTVSPVKKDLNSSDKKSNQKNDSNSYARKLSFDNVIIHDHSLKSHNLQTVKHAKKSHKHDESRSSPKKKHSESISDSTHNTHTFFDKKENSHRKDETNKVEVEEIIKKEKPSDWSDTNTPVKKQHTNNSNGLVTPENHSELKKRKKKKKSHGDHFYLSDTPTPVKNHSDSDHAKKKKKKSHKNDKIANIGDDCKDSSLETHKSVKNKSFCNESIDLSPTNTPDFEFVKRKKKKKLHRDYETDNVEVDSENGSLKKNKSVKKRKHSLNCDSVSSEANTPPKKQLIYTDDRNGEISQDNHSDFEFVKRKKKEKHHTDFESSLGVDQLPKKKEKVHSFKRNGGLDEFKIKDLAWDYDLMRDELDLHHKERISDEHKAMLQHLVVEIPWPVPESHLIETRMSTHPSKAQQAKFIELGLDMKRDHYTLDEDDKILRNWDNFCKLHDLPNDPQPFFAFEASRDSKIKGSVLPKIQRINFVRFLGHGLSHRCLFSIYRRFKKLFEPTKKGKFSREEDAIIMNFVKHSLEANKFAQLAVLLNRDRHAILLRHKKLARNTTSPIRVCQTLYR